MALKRILETLPSLEEPLLEEVLEFVTQKKNTQRKEYIQSIFRGLVVNPPSHLGSRDWQHLEISFPVIFKCDYKLMGLYNNIVVDSFDHSLLTGVEKLFLLSFFKNGDLKTLGVRALTSDWDNLRVIANIMVAFAKGRASLKIAYRPLDEYRKCGSFVIMGAHDELGFVVVFVVDGDTVHEFWSKLVGIDSPLPKPDVLYEEWKQNGRPRIFRQYASNVQWTYDKEKKEGYPFNASNRIPFPA